jgi:hypothetical protein
MEGTNPNDEGQDERVGYGDDEATWPSWWSPNTLLMAPVSLQMDQS